MTLLPRIFYILAALVLCLLLRPNPNTLFMAACFSCLTLPIYRSLEHRFSILKTALQTNDASPRVLRIGLFTCSMGPITLYSLIILLSIAVPVATLVLLVSPQAVAGLARLRQLMANNFQLPSSWVENIQGIKESIGKIPVLQKLIDDMLANIDSIFNDAVGMLVSRSFGFLGSTMTIVWTVFLFLVLTVLFTVYAKNLHVLACRITGIPAAVMHRFMQAIHRALRAIMLGIVLVALIQGFLCGVGFAVAGTSQPAFWGMLASLVAPIPIVGTAIVWLPLSLSLWFTGKTVAAVGLALWGVIAVAGVDNILRPFFLRQGINAPFFVLILAILCGLASFGSVGLVAGPVLLAFAIQAIEEGNRLYSNEE